MEIRPFDPHAATEAEWQAINTYNNHIRAEAWPEDPPTTVEDDRGWEVNIPPINEVHRWVAWDGERVIGRGRLWIRHTKDNQHLAGFHIGVLPEARRQGLARQFLALIVPVAQAAGRRLLEAFTDGMVPSGAAFLERLGGKKGLESHTNQLRIADVDREMVQAWQAQAAARADGLTLRLLEGPYPDDELPAVLQALNALNDMPHGELDTEPWQFTPELVRSWEKSMAARGMVRWTMYVRDEATGEGCGYTEVIWNPLRPTILEQMGTAVRPQYRNRGLGRWLKAAMLDKVLRERPEVQLIRTGNADSNGPMLKINYALGFRPYKSEAIWQVEVERAAQYLAERGALEPVA